MTNSGYKGSPLWVPVPTCCLRAGVVRPPLRVGRTTNTKDEGDMDVVLLAAFKHSGKKETGWLSSAYAEPEEALPRILAETETFVVVISYCFSVECAIGRSFTGRLDHLVCSGGCVSSVWVRA